MKKLNKSNLTKLVYIMIILGILIIGISLGKDNSINPNSKKIAELSYELNELETHKMICLDNLSYKESVDHMNWIHSHCIAYDERMMAVSEEIERLKSWEEIQEEKEREPWMVNEEGTAQVMPEVEWNDSHEKFKNLCNAYWLDASVIWNIENHYWIKEGVIACITVAETSWGQRWYGKSNPWNVGNNDRWDRVQYALFETGLEKIAQTLNNKYLWSIQTLGCLSNGWSCQDRDNNWKRYATSNWNWERNMKACLETIYWTVDPSTFSVRR